jgi:hypothetical protein
VEYKARADLDTLQVVDIYSDVDRFGQSVFAKYIANVPWPYSYFGRNAPRETMLRVWSGKELVF